MELTRLSKYISLILRHKPEVIGVRMDLNGGWVAVDELIEKINAAGKYSIDRKLLEEIVRDDEKGRYAFSKDGKRIRACQGHSLNVIMDFEEIAPPEVLFHGTAWRFLGLIMSQGLKPMKRKYVHLSPDPETALKVGRRHGEPVILRVRAGDMHRAGHKFYLSDNGVWLAESVPAEYLEVMEER